MNFAPSSVVGRVSRNKVLFLLLWDLPRKGGSHSSLEAMKDVGGRHKGKHWRRIEGYIFKQGLRTLEGKVIESGILNCNIELEPRDIAKEF